MPAANTRIYRPWSTTSSPWLRGGNHPSNFCASSSRRRWAGIQQQQRFCRCFCHHAAQRKQRRPQHLSGCNRMGSSMILYLLAGPHTLRSHRIRGTLNTRGFGTFQPASGEGGWACGKTASIAPGITQIRGRFSDTLTCRAPIPYGVPPDEDAVRYKVRISQHPEQMPLQLRARRSGGLPPVSTR